MADARGVGYESGSSDGTATSRLLSRRREGSDDDVELRGDGSLLDGDREGFGDESDGAGRAPEDEEGSDVEGEEVLEGSEVAERKTADEVWVPRNGAFYMHDDRTVGRGRRGRQCRYGVRRKDIREAGDRTKWQHDKYEEMQRWENEDHPVSTKAARRYGSHLQDYGKSAARDYGTGAYSSKHKEESDHENRPLRVVRGRGPIKYNPHECTRIGAPKLVNKYQEPRAMAAHLGSEKLLVSGSHVFSAPNIHDYSGSCCSETSVPQENRCFLPPSSALLHGNPLGASFIPDNGRAIHFIDSNHQSISMTLQSSRSAQWSELTLVPQSTATPKHIIEDIHLRSAVQLNSFYKSQPSSPASSVLDPGLLNTFHGLSLAHGTWPDNRSGIVRSHETGLLEEPMIINLEPTMDFRCPHSGHHSVDRTLVGCMTGNPAHFGRGNSLMPWRPFSTNPNLGPCYLSYPAHSTGCLQSFDVDGSQRDQVVERITSRGRTTSGARVVNNGYGQRGMKPRRYSQMNFHQLND